MQKSVTILNFSPRTGGNCGKISNYISKQYKRTDVRSYHITAENISGCHDCNYECLKPGALCPSITEYQKEIMDRICISDLVYYIVPNFCGHPCANYYAFNERSVGYFNGDRERLEQYMSSNKRFIIVSNTENETFKTAMYQQTKGEPEMLFMKTGKYQKKSIAGDILNSDDAVADLRSFLEQVSLY